MPSTMAFFFILAKIKGTLNCGRPSGQTVWMLSKTSRIPPLSSLQWEVLCSLDMTFWTMTITWGDYRASFGTLWQGNLILRGSYKAIQSFALVVQVRLAVKCWEKNSLIQIFKPKWLISLTEVQHKTSHDQLKRFWQTSSFPQKILFFHLPH